MAEPSTPLPEQRISTNCSKCNHPFRVMDTIEGHETATWHSICPTPLPEQGGDGILKQRVYEEIACIFAGKDLSHEQIAALMDDRKEYVEQIMRFILADRKQHELDARIAGIEEAHKEILDVVFTYRSKDPNFCDVDDVSRVSMSWKVDRIAKLKAEREALC